MYKRPPVAPTIQKQLNIQSSISSIDTWKFEQEAAKKSFIWDDIFDEIPFIFVQKEVFKKFMSKV